MGRKGKKKKPAPDEQWQYSFGLARGEKDNCCGPQKAEQKPTGTKKPPWQIQGGFCTRGKQCN
jgi:hypothetical protein